MLSSENLLVREPTSSDFKDIDFEDIMAMHEPFTFYVFYLTIKGSVLGKLMITDFEVIFEPLNEKFKGFVNQGEGSLLGNKKCQMAINYEDISEEILVMNLPDKIYENKEEVSMNYFFQLNVHNTGWADQLLLLHRRGNQGRPGQAARAGHAHCLADLQNQQCDSLPRNARQQNQAPARLPH